MQKKDEKTYTTLYDLFVQQAIKNEGLKPFACLPVVDEPPRQNDSVLIVASPLSPESKKPTVKKIKVKAFEIAEAKKRGIKSYSWTTVNQVPEPVRYTWNATVAKQGYPPIQIGRLASQFYQQPNAVALYHMGTFGWGAIALRNFAKDEPVATYSGLLLSRIPGHLEDISTHTVGLAVDHQLFAPAVLDGTKVKVTTYGGRFSALINARTCGDYGSFFPHFPKEEELPDWLKHKGIATENVSAGVESYCNYPSYFLVANQPISAGSLVGFSYSKSFLTGVDPSQDYWHQKGLKPALFTKNGKPTLYSMDTITGEISDQFFSHSLLGFFSHKELSANSRVSKKFYAIFSKLAKERRESLPVELFSTPHPMFRKEDLEDASATSMLSNHAK